MKIEQERIGTLGLLLGAISLAAALYFGWSYSHVAVCICLAIAIACVLAAISVRYERSSMGDYIGFAHFELYAAN